MAARPRKVQFVADPVLEGNDFAFEVDRETFVAVMDRDPFETGEDDGRKRGLFRILPQFLAAAFRDAGRVFVKLEVSQV